MNMPSNLPASVTQPPSKGLSRGFGGVVQEVRPTLRGHINSIRARKWLVITITFLITALAAALVNLMTPIYRSSVTLLIENAKSRVVSIEEVYGIPTASREFFQTQAEFMKSREVGMRVINEMNLAENEFYDPRGPKRSPVRELLKRFPWLENLPGSSTGASELTVEEASEAVLARYRDNIEVVPVRLSQLVEIRFDSPDPMLAAKIANQTAEAYITADLDARFTMQQTASKWLNERLELLRRELEKSEVALQAYREEMGLVATPSSTSSMSGNVKSLDTSSERLILARVERAEAEQIYRQVQRNSANRYEVPVVFNNPSVQAARAQESAAEKRLADAAQALGPAHPDYRAAQADLITAKENTRRQAEGVISSIAKQYEVARNREKALEEAVAAAKGDIRDINRKEGQLNVLERNVATNNQIYQTFLARVKETDATADFRNPVARVVDAAVPALEPVRPRKALIVLGAALMAAVLASMIVVAMEQKSVVIRSTDEVLDKLGTSLIVATPRVSGKQMAALPRLQHDDPYAMFSEAIRSASIGVRLATMNVPRPVIGFTSTLPGEGKSTIALNFAIEQARTRKTLLIDCDMRSPSIRRMLSIHERSMGLSELLRGEPIGSCIQNATDLNLSLLLSSGRVKNPHDLLMSAGFVEMMTKLKTQFDLIVIDSPPLELVSDALPIGQQTTGMIYVVKAGETPIPMVRRGLNRLHTANIHVLGVVLNAHDFARAGKYYNEYSAYGSYESAYSGNRESNA